MRKAILAILFVVVASLGVVAQKVTVTGRVTDSSGAAIGGASVKIKGAKGGVSADNEGKFSILVEPNSTLMVSSVGYLPNQFAAANFSGDVVLQSNGKVLEEVIVTALGQSRSKDKIGYTATSFKSSDIVRAAPVSALDGLQGRVAGADISTTGGQPGSSSKIILRGYTSFGGNNQALIVVDGVPFNNSRLGSFNDFANKGGVDFGNGLNDLNPNDIDNITILKGAAATSLYGSRANNGVVIVTTKKGKSGKLVVDFTSSGIASQVAKMPDFQNSFGQGWNGQHWKEENGSWGPKLDGVTRVWGSEVDNSRLIKPFSAIKNNVKDFYDQGFETTNTLSIRGGSDNANFYMSYANVYSDGILPNDVDMYRRNTISMRGQLKAKNFTASASLNYINKNGKNVNSASDAQGSSSFENLIQMGRDIPITDFRDYKNKFFNVDNYFTPYASNPYYSLNENGNRNKNNRVFGNINLGYELLKGLSVKWVTGIDVGNADVKDWQAIEAPKPNTWRGTPSTNAESTGLTAPLIGGVRELNDYALEMNTDFFINYNKDFKLFNFSGFVGVNYNDRESKSHESRIKGLTIPNYYNLSNSSNPPDVDASYFHRRLIGAFGQVNLSYSDFAFLTFNARNDWSSTLPSGTSFFYPGVNGSLLVSRIADVSKMGISYFKLRGSIGKTGKDAGTYLLESVGTSASAALGFGNLTFPLGGVSAFEIGNRIGNNALKPEITTEYEIGTEIRFLKDRLGIDFSYYNKRTKDQILEVPIAASTGFLTEVRNFGLVENKGIELAATIVPIKSRNFNWTMTYTFTKNNNKVLELPAGLGKVDFNSSYDIKMVARVGSPIGIIEAPTKMTTSDGKYIVSSTGYFAQSPEDGVYGNVQRKFFMGLNNNFTYKALSLGFTLDYRAGGKFVSRTADLTYFVGNAWETQYNDRRPFIIPNSVVQNGVDATGKPIYAENTTPITMNTYNSYWYHTNNQVNSWEKTILPKDFVKLRDITISYNLPSYICKKISAQNVTISLIGRNFLIWVPKENTFIDPEVTNLGNDLLGEFGEQAASASTRSFGAAIKVNF